MKSLKTGISWIDKVIPDGLPLDSSTIISGPGGSRKPLIGETFVSAWLKEGGSVVFMSLQYPNTKFVTTSIKNVTDLNLNDYADKIIFLQLDVSITDLIDEGNNIIRANLVKPEVWDKALRIGKEADNLIISGVEKEPFRLFMKVVRIKDFPFDSNEIEVSISSEILNDIKKTADHSRKVVIP